MGTAATTPVLFEKSTMDAMKLWELIDQHNQGVIDDHVLTAKLDADGGVTDVDYEARLTASEIDYAGYTPTQTSVAGDLEPFEPTAMSEELFKKLVAQLNARIVDIRAIAAKLDADATVNDTDYNTLVQALEIVALGETANGASRQVGGPDTGAGISAELLQALTDEHNQGAQDWHDAAAKLDADIGVTDTDYEAQIAQTTIAEA